LPHATFLLNPAKSAKRKNTIQFLYQKGTPAGLPKAGLKEQEKGN
jgi:hypothetical protein